MSDELDILAILARGEAAFMGHHFYVERTTLVPREVSAILVTATVDLVRSGELGPEMLFVDQCGGSGNIGCTLALHIPEARGWSTDLVAASSALARRNIERHGVAGRVEARTGDLFGALDGLDIEGRIDVVTCSPPFISSGRLAGDRASLLAHEPREAFDGGPYGVSIHARVVKESLPYLRPGGYLICECGEGQHKQVELLAKRVKGYEEVHVVSDARGVVRAIRARKARR